jgi:hypothetical protein
LLPGREVRPDRSPAERRLCQVLRVRQRPVPSAERQPALQPQAEPELPPVRLQEPPQAWLVEPMKRQQTMLRPE